MLRKVAFGALFLCLLVTPARADDASTDLARRLRAGELPAAAATLRQAGLTPADAHALLAARATLPAEEGEVELTDAQGRKTTLQVRAPKSPAPASGYPVMIVLHGLRGEGKQLLPLARKLASDGTLLLAPTAQYLDPARENEDMWEELGKPVEEAPENDKGAQRREQFQRLLKLARDQVFPHWWSYKADAFPLQALAWAHQHYTIDPERVVLLGYSMGGYGTWNVGLRYADRFAGIVPIAGGISRRENAGPRDEVSRALLGNGRMVPSFFLHGNADPIVPVRFSRTIDADLTALGAAHEYIEVDGEGHHLRAFLGGDESTDRVRAWVAERRRESHPRHVEHTALGAYHGASYWVRIEGLEGKTARVSADVQDGNRIVVTTEGVTKLGVFLDPTLIDVAQPVTVTLNGAVAFEGPVAASLEAVTDSWGTRRDPSLVYEHVIELQVGAPAPAATPEPAPAPAGRSFK